MTAALEWYPQWLNFIFFATNEYYSSTVNKIHNELTKNKEFRKNNSNLEPCLISQIDIENLSFDIILY